LHFIHRVSLQSFICKLTCSCLTSYCLCSAEKALKKKQIGIKMASRDSASEAIVDIVLQNKSKRPPDGYTVAG